MAVTESSGNGYALYNGVKLPRLPEWDKTAYPYAYLEYADASYVEPGAYTVRFVVSREQVVIGAVTPGKIRYDPPFFQGMYTNSQAVCDMMAEYGMEDFVANEWMTTTVTGAWLEPAALPTWANCDILYADGTTYLTASTSIPLDGMTVIEWDGDTEGLVSTNGQFYKVSDATGVNLNGAAFTYIRATGGLDTGYLMHANEDGVQQGAFQNADGTYTLVCIVCTSWEGFEDGLYFVSPVSGTYTSLLAYTPAAVEDDTTDNSLDPTYMLTGWLVGRAVAAQRGKVTPSEPDTPDEPEKQLIGYSYNGVVLPDINEVWTDKETYPYAYITPPAEESPVATLVLFSHAGTFYDDAVWHNFNGSEGRRAEFCYTNSQEMVDVLISYFPEAKIGEWFLISEKTLSWNEGVSDVVWSSYDVLNTDGSIYLAASEPIPVYE